MRNRIIQMNNEKGMTLFIGILSMLFIIPMVGLAIDVGFLYVVKSKLQAAVDGASLAAARALTLGQTTQSQASAAQAHAVNWFYANLPNSYFGVKNTVMDTNHVQVFDDPNNANLRHVTVNGSTQVDTFFMKWFGFDATTVSASGDATRRDAVIMMVLDRSGSMGASCTDLRNSAKLFAGQFAANRDYIGAVSFSENVVLLSTPTRNFQTVLGYTNDSGTGAGALDNITCGGGTGTAQGIAWGYNELYKTNLPGALNLIMFETDGLPNTLTLNFWDNPNTVAGIANASTCKDKAGLTKSLGGFATSLQIPSWTGGHAMGAGSYFSDIPAGIIGGVYSMDPYQGPPYQLAAMMQYYTGNQSLSWLNGTNCNFDGGQWYTTPSDLAWFPATDIYGTRLNPPTNSPFAPYKGALTMNGSHVSNNGWTNYHNGVLNATDYIAYRVRTNMGQAAGAGIGPAYFFGIGLGGNAGDGPDFILMQRMANDPNGDLYNSPTNYSTCATEPTCINYADQPQGTFIYSSDRTKLVQAFLSVASQILRMNK